jgi:hypothetical protein
MARSKPVAEYLDEAHYDQWNQLVAASPTGAIYNTPVYLEALCSATGGRFRILGVRKGDELLGGVALYEERGFPGRRVSNRSLLYYNGIVLKNVKLKYRSEQTARQLAVLNAIEERLSSNGCGRLVLHNRCRLTDVRPFLSNGWSARPAYSYVVDITDLDKAWGRIEQNLRRLIERCRQSEVSFSGDDDFDSFYRLHHDTHVRKGAPLYLPKKAYRRYFESLRRQNLCRLFFARAKDGRAVAVQLVLLGDHPTCHTVCAAADAEYLKLGTTPYLRWRAFEELSHVGYQANDLTDAALNTVTRFKSQLGGELAVNLVLKRPDWATYVWGERLEKLGRKLLGPAYRLYKRTTDNGA